jgi:hypothetical protein
VDRIDHDVGPETAAVFANTPTFGLKATVAVRRLQNALRFMGLAIFFGVKAREMLTQYLMARIAFDPLGTCVPTAHAPLRIKHENGIVGDALNQKPELLFRTPKLFLREHTLR